MKQVILFMALAIALLSSCGTKDIEQEANEQLVLTMKEAVRDPDGGTLVNVHTTYKSDSLCILHFTLKAKNALGMDMSAPIEYIYVDCTDEGKRVKLETYTDLDPLFPVGLTMKDREEEIAKSLAEKGYDYAFLMQNTVEKIKEKYRDKLLKDAPYTDKDPNLEDRLMFSAAWLRLSTDSRDVTNLKGKDIKL